MKDRGEITTITGSPEDLDRWIYRQNDTGVFVHEVKIDAVSPGRKRTDIVQITDVHLNYTNTEDEKDEEVMYTRQCRRWNAGGVSAKALENAMRCAKGCDRIVITGDTLDYLSCGAMELMQKYIWDAEPDCIVALGGHDTTKQMETHIPDKLPLKERLEILQKFWKHDIYYFSEVINDNVMIIQLDNSQHKYWDFQIPKLERDLKRARGCGYTVLIFQHEPICTGKREDAVVYPYYRWPDNRPVDNFYDKCICCEENSDAATMGVYRLITGNADIVRGIFCGHYHASFYTEVEGSFVGADGKTYRRSIPQRMLECNVYDGYTGHIARITVK